MLELQHQRLLTNFYRRSSWDS